MIHQLPAAATAALHLWPGQEGWGSEGGERDQLLQHDDEEHELSYLGKLPEAVLLLSEVRERRHFTFDAQQLVYYALL